MAHCAAVQCYCAAATYYFCERAMSIPWGLCAQVGNYDYLYDVRFQLNGEIRVVVNMAGEFAAGAMSCIQLACFAGLSHQSAMCFNCCSNLTVILWHAGYMQNEYFDDEHGLTQKDLRFGTRTQQQVLSNIHDHLSSWKVDFDINGTSNSFHMTVGLGCQTCLHL